MIKNGVLFDWLLKTYAYFQVRTAYISSKLHKSKMAANANQTKWKSFKK